MSKKINNKKLLIILVVLVGIFLTTNYIKNNRSTTTIDTDLIHIDTNAVSSISIYPTVGNKKEVTFTKQANNWNVKSDEISSKVKTGAIHQILTELSNIKINRLVSKTKDKWEKYQLTDSLSTRLQIMEKDKGKTLDIYLGKIKYSQPTRGYNQYGQNSFSGSTYIRLADSPNIYEVDGFLSMTFNQNFNSWRKNDFLKTNKENLNQIQFHQANNNFTISKNDSIWSIENEMVDSTKIERYLSLLTNQQINNFGDSYSPRSLPDYSLTINGNNMDNIKLDCYSDSLTGNYYMESSLNPGVFLKTDSAGLFNQLFVSKDYFME